MKSIDIIKCLANKLNISRQQAKHIAFPYLYGSLGGINQLIKDFDLETK